MSFFKSLFGRRRTTQVILDIPKDIRRIYAIGDVHGRVDLLEDMETRILKEIETPEETMILLLGDMIDRGPFSAHVLDHVLRPPKDGIARRCLMGNHEKMLIDVIDGGIDPRDWIAAGGASTLQSYSDAGSIRLEGGSTTLRRKIVDMIPTDHVDFLRALPRAAKAKGVLFSHAGGDPGKSLLEQDEDDLISSRIAGTKDQPVEGRLSIFGHMRQPDFLVKEFRICIDLSGAERDTLGAARVDLSNTPRVSFLQENRDV